MKLIDRIRCRLGWHEWGPGEGARCVHCSQVRGHRHRWAPSGCYRQVCSVCGKSRQSPMAHHEWTGCVCAVCGKKRDAAHEWGSGDTRCARCNAVRPSHLVRTDDGKVVLVLEEASLPDAGAREESWVTARRELMRFAREPVERVACPRRWGESRTSGEVFTREELGRPLPFTCDCMEGTLRNLRCPACGKTVDRAESFRRALGRLRTLPAARAPAAMNREACATWLLKCPEDWREEDVWSSEIGISVSYRSLGMSHVKNATRVGEDAYVGDLASYLDD